MRQPLPLYVRIPTLSTIITLTAHPTCVNAQTVDGQWTWESGSNTGAVAVYGAKGVAATGNVPGNRYSQSGWADASGESLITNMSQTVNVSRLPPGVYLLQLSNGASLKILKTQ